jgi:hypothetical protein
MAVVVRKRAIAAVVFRWDVELSGVKDGVNLTFSVPGEKFVQTGNIGIRVHLNGQRLFLGAGNDYAVSESGGPGTGYDTVILTVPPVPWERITADYIAAP